VKHWAEGGLRIARLLSSAMRSTLLAFGVQSDATIPGMVRPRYQRCRADTNSAESPPRIWWRR
jgi:hypothetical protein